jgi:hypothetical protein
MKEVRSPTRERF